MPTAFPFFTSVIFSLCSSSEKRNTSVTSQVASVGSTGGLRLLNMVPRSLMSSWCATWLELTRHAGVEVMGSLERFLIVVHVLRLLSVRSVDVMNSSLLFHHSVN